MDKLVELTKDVWEFGCKGDVIKVTADRLKELEKKAAQLGGEAYVEFKKDVAEVGDAVKGLSPAAKAAATKKANAEAAAKKADEDAKAKADADAKAKADADAAAAKAAEDKAAEASAAGEGTK
jgi:colicin import membrane protein